MPNDGHDQPPVPRQVRFDHGPPAAPEMIHARAVAERVGADRAAVVLTSGLQHRAVLTGSDPVLVAFGDMVETVSQGPAVDVLTSAAPCTVEDLPHELHRWPLLGGTFGAPAPLTSLLVVPLAAPEDPLGPDDVFGVLVLSRDHRRPTSDHDTATAAHGAGLLSVMLMARALRGDPDQAGSALDALIHPRTDALARAVGALAHHYETTDAIARTHLLARALAADQTLPAGRGRTPRGPALMPPRPTAQLGPRQQGLSPAV